jgi:hypothetical protein
MPRQTATLARWAAPALALLALIAPPLEAQRTAGRTIRIDFTPGSATQNGYADAQVEFTYYFGRCLNDVALLGSYNPVPRMVVGQPRYWVDGRQVTVPPTISAPNLSPPTVVGTVRGNGIAKDISYIHATSGRTPGCFANDLSIGPVSQFWQAGVTAEAQLAVLNGFGLDVRGMLPPLRNIAVEEWVRRQIAAERADSVAKARAAEEARQTARRDSIQRAQQVARARQDSMAQQARAVGTMPADGGASATAGATPSSGGGASGTPSGTPASGGGSSGTPSGEAARRQAEAEAAQSADMERRRAEAQARMAEEERRRKQEQDSAFLQTTAELGAATLELVGPAIERFFQGMSGTGLAFGVSYSAPYFQGDGGRIGLTITAVASDIVLPFFEMGFMTGGEANLKSEHTYGPSITVGSVIPKTRFASPLGKLQPHAGLTFLPTIERVVRAQDRTRTLLMVGVTRVSRTPIRLDATIYGGSPRFGAAIAYAF